MYLPKFTILSPGDRTNSNPLYPKMLCSKLVKFDYWEKDSIKSINRISIQIYTQNTDLWEHCKHCWHCHRKTVTFFLTHPKILKIISFFVYKKKITLLSAHITQNNKKNSNISNQCLCFGNTSWSKFTYIFMFLQCLLLHDMSRIIAANTHFLLLEIKNLIYDNAVNHFFSLVTQL